jgi:hypothetical protein
LYDPNVLEDVRRVVEQDDPPTPMYIKEHVDTSAHVYEIRTAIEYWTGGQNDTHRYSDAVWNRCRAVENGKFVPTEYGLLYPDDPRVSA